MALLTPGVLLTYRCSKAGGSVWEDGDAQPRTTSTAPQPGPASVNPASICCCGFQGRLEANFDFMQLDSCRLDLTGLCFQELGDNI